MLVEFDGVMQNSDVWFNGHLLGHRPNGYVGFSYDLTPYVSTTQTNTLVVRCDTSAQPASRWYSGAGIYRPMRFCFVSQVHLTDWNPIVTTPVVTVTSAVVRVQTTITNEWNTAREINLQTLVCQADSGRKIVGNRTPPQILAAHSSITLTQELVVPAPKLWNTETPALYQVISQLHSNKQMIDFVKMTVGIRTAEFTPEQGFVLNGKKVVLKGVCLHHDGGAFGAAVPLAIWEDRLTTLRSLGVNAIRTAHNPPAPEFLDLCDRLGFLVMDEFFDCWTVGKTSFDYHLDFNEWSSRDAADTVRRDRNHPSVILYSIGNEIHDTPQPALALPIAQRLVEVCHENDPTRPVTQALFRPNTSGDYTNGLADALDVVGTNYRDSELLAAQRAKPTRKIIGTEQRHDRETWLNLRDHPSHAGQFLWTGVDYLGESKQWPRVAHASGLLDRTGAIKPRAFERQSWWSETPMVSICRRVAPDDKLPTDPGYGGAELHTQVEFADWTPRNPAPHDESVQAYSNCEEVELFLNDKSLGAKKINADATPRVWKIPFTPGSLKAVAKNGGKVVATDELRTAGAPAAIQLETRNSKLGTSWNDVAIVRATVVDTNGVPVPRADDLISFSVTGPGVVAAVDNGDNDSNESFQATQRHAYHGAAVAFVKISGTMFKMKFNAFTVTAKAAGLKSGSLKISPAE
jgi:beta-galactosidase